MIDITFSRSYARAHTLPRYSLRSSDTVTAKTSVVGSVRPSFTGLSLSMLRVFFCIVRDDLVNLFAFFGVCILDFVVNTAHPVTGQTLYRREKKG